MCHCDDNYQFIIIIGHACQSSSSSMSSSSAAAAASPNAHLNVNHERHDIRILIDRIGKIGRVHSIHRQQKMHAGAAHMNQQQIITIHLGPSVGFLRNQKCIRRSPKRRNGKQQIITDCASFIRPYPYVMLHCVLCLL